MVVIDMELHEKLKEYAHSQKASIKAVVATVLNEFLASQGAMPAELKAQIENRIKALGSPRRSHSAFNPWAAKPG
jgi:hypothetical protein